MVRWESEGILKDLMLMDVFFCFGVGLLSLLHKFLIFFVSYLIDPLNPFHILPRHKMTYQPSTMMYTVYICMNVYYDVLYNMYTNTIVTIHIHLRSPLIALHFQKHLLWVQFQLLHWSVKGAPQECLPFHCGTTFLQDWGDRWVRNEMSTDTH